MSENRKYYYMRLKENFFDTDSMVLLESMKDGYIYSNILLKMYLKSLKCNGKLLLNDYIPYDVNMIATITRHQVGTVEKAIKIFEQLGLIDILENGVIYMSDIELMIGQSSTEAERKMKARKDNKKECEIGQTSDICPRVDICPPEIEIDIDKDIYISADAEKKQKKTKHKYGEYQNILLTDEEFQKLSNEFPNLKERIENLSSYVASTGKSYKSHYATIKRWAQMEREKYSTKAKKNSFNNFPQNDLDFQDYENSILSN